MNRATAPVKDISFDTRVIAISFIDMTRRDVTARNVRETTKRSMEGAMSIPLFDELSDAELTRIERLISQASPGPWISYVAGRDANAASSCIELGTCNELGSFRSMELTGGSVADQDFIAAARQDLPRLVLEVRMLRALLESLLPEEERPALRGMGNLVEASGSLRSAPR
jgi:hypothetical protein